jgi:hypothetical protein
MGSRPRRALLRHTWVDGSGECELAAFAGASTRYGTHGAVEAGTLGIRFGGVPAGGSLRVMGTALATGHAAGVAAALHAAAGNPVPARQVQQELQRQDARLTGC